MDWSELSSDFVNVVGSQVGKLKLDLPTKSVTKKNFSGV